MLRLSKKDNTVYPEIQVGEQVKLGKNRYTIMFSDKWGFYLSGIGCRNDTMFEELGIEDKESWCEAHGITVSDHGVFPYMDGPSLSRCIGIMKNEFKLINQ